MLAPDPEKAWGDAQRCIGEKYAEAYDRAVALMCDLRDLARQSGPAGEEAFRKRIVALRAKYSSRSALLRKMSEKDLRG